MEQERKIRVAITQGDTNGVGYEVIFKVFEEPGMLELCTPVIYGSPKIAAYHKKALNLDTNLNIINHNITVWNLLYLLETFLLSSYLKQILVIYETITRFGDNGII